MNKEGRVLVKLIEKRGWEIFNGRIKRKIKRKCIYAGTLESTVIDYVLGDKEIKERVREMKTTWIRIQWK